MQKGILICLVAFVMSGCSGYQKAVGAYTVIESVLALAQAELPNLPPADQPIAQGFISAAGNMNNQYKSCIDNAQSSKMSTKGKFVACLNLCATALNDPKELAALRFLSPTTQRKVQLYITAIQTGLNVVLANFGSPSTQPAPQVGTAPAPTKAELNDLFVPTDPTTSVAFSNNTVDKVEFYPDFVLFKGKMYKFCDVIQCR
jgi:dihydroorotate dehydrogenase